MGSVTLSPMVGEIVGLLSFPHYSVYVSAKGVIVAEIVLISSTVGCEGPMPVNFIILFPSRER